MNLLQRVNGRIEALFSVPEPAPAPVRPLHPCGVGDCYEVQTLVSQDERETVVDCPTHDARTTWPTTPPEPREQRIIRVQDAWRQHGTAPPKK